MCGRFTDLYKFDAWLDGSTGKEVLIPAPEDMLRKWPVSKRINSSRAPGDDPTLIDPIEQTDSTS